MKKLFKFVLAIVIAVVVLVGIGIGVTAYTASKVVKSVDHTVKTMQKQTTSKDQELQAMLAKAKPVETHTDMDYSVEYTLTNDTKDSFDYVQINADVFDKGGVKLGNDMTNITNVQPGQTFKLKLDLYQEGATSYKITNISSSAK
jgi:hypothetical protein